MDLGLLLDKGPPPSLAPLPTAQTVWHFLVHPGYKLVLQDLLNIII